MTRERSETRARLSWRFALWVTIGGCLLLPLLAMQVTDQVAWTAYDFIAASVLLLGAGLALELVFSLPIPPISRTIVGLAVAAAVALLWAHGAVGLFWRGLDRARAGWVAVRPWPSGAEVGTCAVT